MAIETSYSYFRISKSEGIHHSAQKYRDLRLQALKLSPGSFSSTYELESTFTEEDWVERLTVPGREVFICASTTSSESNQPITEWIGQVTLRGPASVQEFTMPVESGQPVPLSDKEEERWQMLSLFTLPGHRGNGLGANLCRAALEYLRTYQSSPQSVSVRLIIKSGNDVAVKLYERLGFVHAGMSTLLEALIANGDAHLLPEDVSDAKWTLRGGIIMMSRIDRS